MTVLAKAPGATAAKFGQAIVQTCAAAWLPQKSPTSRESLTTQGGGSSLDVCAEQSMQSVAQIHRLVQHCVSEVDSAMRLYVFGSVAVYGLREPGSDVDLVALHQNDTRSDRGESKDDATSELAKGVQCDLLATVGNVMRRRHMHWDVALIRRTRVPVLRVTGDASGVDVDITVHRHNGVRNSALLRAYFEQMPVARLASMAIKRWSKRTNLNAACRGGCITSYGFNLMLVYFLLRRQLVRYIDPRRCTIDDISALPTYFPVRLDTAAAQAAGELVCDFLQYYMREFDMNHEVVTLSRPGITTKEQIDWTKQSEDLARIRGEKIHYRLCIEDPYEINLNVGRKVTPFQVIMLQKQIERAIQTGDLLLT